MFLQFDECAFVHHAYYFNAIKRFMAELERSIVWCVNEFHCMCLHRFEFGGRGGFAGRGGKGTSLGEGLRAPRWDLSRLPRFEKNFYQESPAVTNRSVVRNFCIIALYHILQKCSIRTCRIFDVKVDKTLTVCRNDLPYLGSIIERRKQRFVDHLIGINHFDPVLRSTTYSTVLSVLS